MSLYYLVSSLPSFNFGDKPFYSSESFVRLCSDWITKEDFNELNKLSLVPSKELSGKSAFTRKWYDYVGSLANALARTRAINLGRELRDSINGCSVYSDVEKTVQEAFASDNPLEKEKKIDQLKWTIIDYLEAGHQFDFDKLCAYKLKLLLCERWLERKEAQGIKNLDASLAKLYTPSDEK